MVGPDRIEWRRGFPSRAWGRLGWFVTGGSTAIVIVFVLFGSEPEQLDTGRTNLLALVPTGVTILVAVIAMPFVLALFRRPLVAADHYALTVRPGILRTLLLPWARIAEVAAYGARDEPFLLVRCGNRHEHVGDVPRWWDKAVLRAALRSSRRPARSGSGVGAYHVAVRMDEFVGPPETLLVSLAPFAPNHVIVTYALD
jgi:hypothetical protein